MAAVGQTKPGDGEAPRGAIAAPVLALESPAAAWIRRMVLLSFWIVVIALGVPHWIWTTSIHRSALPLDSMNLWAEGKACDLHYPVHIFLQGVGNASSVPDGIAFQVESILTARNEFPLYSFHVLQGDQDRDVLATSSLTVILKPDSEVKSLQASLRSWSAILDIVYSPSRLEHVTALANFIAEQIHPLFTKEKLRTSYLLHSTPFGSAELGQTLTLEEKSSMELNNLRAFKPSSTYHLTFSLFTASDSPSKWDIEDAIENSIQPLLNHIQRISDLTVDTQVQLFAAFSPSISGPQFDEKTKEWKLQKSDLSGFINAAEWPLSPGIGAGPTINFVLYVPSKHQSPLILAETGGNSWLIPQWGGVQILNPTEKQRERLTAEDLHPVMLTFADQLSTLMGVPATTSPLYMRVSSLARERTTSLIMSASSTLGALSRLTMKLTSIAIPDLVAKSVAESINRLDQSCRDLSGGKLQSALKNARIAEIEAEQAFFEPSMVGQVYFPDEHKVAIYVPLLGPMGVPLLMAGVNELKTLRTRGKAKTA